jgi:nucleoside-diphosphate-sugar epimerase
MAKVLVTGAGGYIGSTLVPALLERGYTVRAVDRYFFGADVLPSDKRIEVVKEDTRRLGAAHFVGIDAVVDLAAVSNDPSGELFQRATWAINCDARVRAASLAKQAGVRRYILPSSCSIYGFQADGVVVNEQSPTQPLTTYAKANQKAEEGVLPLGDDRFTAVVLRQATVFGYSPRMRFDLAINGMTYGAWKNGVLPLMRDGAQWRPMLHVKDAAAAICFMLQADADRVNGERFNIGGNENNYQIGNLADIVVGVLPKPVRIEWYGDPDHRSYRVSFDKLTALGFRTRYTARDGAREVFEALESGKVERSAETITLEWYKELVRWHRLIRDVEMYGGILDLCE